MSTALIVIDMQQGSFTAASPRHDAAGLVQRLNRLAAGVRARGGTVVFVQHDSPLGDPHHPDAPGWHFLTDLDVRDGDPVVRKTSCDSFLHTSLDDLLQARAIDRLIVTGGATDYCVDTTVRSALARGYRTIVPSDGHTTADRPHLPPRSSSTTTPSGRTSWRRAGPPKCCPVRRSRRHKSGRRYPPCDGGMRVLNVAL